MDNIADPDITFDENGVSNYYFEYKKEEKEGVFLGEEGIRKLDDIVNQIKKSGKGKKYDCVIGVSGGVDSTYVALLAKRYGLRGLLVHFDNGWNSELAVKNVQSIIDFTGFDLFTYVVDWELFRDVQRSLIRASVVDVELCTDMFIGDAIVQQMRKFNIKYSLSGNNVVTEAILPKYWYHSKSDFLNLQSIHKTFGSIKNIKLPINEVRKGYWGWNNKYVTIKILNYINYNKESVKQEIIDEIGWRDYGGKHWESVFTKFFQAYILPEKFKIDKRKAHLSTLIFSGQISKVDALEELEQPIYSPANFTTDRDFVLKKLGFTKEQFNVLMKNERIEHSSYGTIGRRSDVIPILKYISFLKPAYRIINEFLRKR
jgi:N-acetyl sugar amidotransferase